MSKRYLIIILCFLLVLSCSAGTLPPKYDDFFKWIEQEGAKFDKVELRDEELRGMFAKEDIKKGDMIVYVPDRLISFLSKAKASPIGSEITKRAKPGELFAPSADMLAIQNLQEMSKGEESFLKYHWALLPGIDDFPAFYTDEEKALLEGSPFLAELELEMEITELDYNKMWYWSYDFAMGYSLRQFSEAKMLVASRYFGVWVKGVNTVIQVPLADMFNAQNPKNARWYYDDDSNGFRVDAHTDIKKGEQVFYTYGRKSNYKFLLNYAYLEESNEFNTFPLAVELPDETHTDELKRDFFFHQNQKSFTKTFHVQGNLLGNATDELLAWCRFVAFEGDVYKLHEQVKQTQAEASTPEQEVLVQIKPLDIATESNAWQLIASLSESALAKFPTSLEQDLKLLEDSTLTYNQQNCIKLRSQDKEILHFLIDTASSVQEISKLTQKQAISMVMKNLKQYKNIMQYVKKTVIPLLPEKKEEENVEEKDEL